MARRALSDEDRKQIKWNYHLNVVLLVVSIFGTGIGMYLTTGTSLVVAPVALGAFTLLTAVSNLLILKKMLAALS